MAEQRKGEVVTNVQEQLDENGNIMSRVTCEWFGFDNEYANKMSIALTEAITNLVKAFNDVKHGKKEGSRK